MKLIKLNAIDSTNDFLKALIIKEKVENFTVVTTERQTNGKGQMGSIWETEEGKNLIMSVFVKDSISGVDEIFNLNVTVAVSIIQALETFKIPQLSIKWPNDIMSYQFKIGGILIENSLKPDGNVHSVIGLGLNVNQIKFDHLPKASSLSVICKKEFDKVAILQAIIEKIKENVILLSENPLTIWKTYSGLLFKVGIPMAFKNSRTHQNFMGIIQGVDSNGQLQVQLVDDSIANYGVKEIQMLY
ncbi:biotin--[acetyl-CoA-carboxylase] ligase [Flavobacterium ovatum]|uniref:biotin--[acetyl-CoA-carboxylase] ligase n=1 Tax=Flavobacterium ovatum TaxID=1928857 RepID=UPI00344F51EB